MMQAVSPVGSLQELENILQEERRVVMIDVFATWCAPCLELKPTLEKFASAHPECRVVSVDSDQVPEVVGALGVRAYPTLFIYLNGEQKKAHLGLIDESGLKELIEL